MTDNEYIKLNRKIIGWEWYLNINVKTLFIHCLLKANWKDGKFEGKDITRGSFVTSLEKLSTETGLSVRQVRTALNHLFLTGELTSKSFSKFRIITVVKYEQYQLCDKQVDNQLTSKRQADDKQVTTIEEVKNLRTKEPKNNNLLNNSDELFNRPSEPDAAEESPYKNYLTLWNSLEPYGITTIRAIRGKRLISLQARLKEYGKKSFAECIEQIKESDFLQKSNFFNFDWMVCKTNYPKVLEGKYNNDKDKGNNKQSSFNMDDFLRRYDE